MLRGGKRSRRASHISRCRVRKTTIHRRDPPASSRARAFVASARLVPFSADLPFSRVKYRFRDILFSVFFFLFSSFFSLFLTDTLNILRGALEAAAVSEIFKVFTLIC